MKTRQSATQQLIIPSREQMVAALAARDAAYDGVFYYGVVTTGVYCRPSCAARPARPENVRFFAAAEDAAAAGFRPCKRCRPERTGAEIEHLVAIARHIETHADDRLTLTELASKAGLSPARLQKSFKAAFGVSPKQYQDGVRLARFKGALRDGNGVTDAIFAAGFGSTSRVYGAAARNLGMTPAAYRAGGGGERIHYACRDSALGPLLLAATERGVCFAQFGESEEQLVDVLRAEYPHARIEPSPPGGGAALDLWIAALDAHLAQHAPRPDLPLDLRGTAFQLRVWRFLLGIAEGDVVSYAEVATGIGRPAAVRAAASACAANRVGVLVPCHRVLKGDGGLGGYRWGIDRKRSLLELERHRKGAGR